ncbi:MAG: hypothetical protein ACREVX_16435 [Clostridium sp.]|uniref:hypothetical protein n=1 Tax=Clostridium sp. TaxID=1506 RepID=UPI003D6D161F
MNKLEKLIDDGFKVRIQSSSKFCLTIDNTTPSMSFNSDSVEEAVDLAYEFVGKQKKVEDIAEREKEKEIDKKKEEVIEKGKEQEKEKEEKEDKEDREEEKRLSEIIIKVSKTQEIKIDQDILNRESKTTTSIRTHTDVCEKFKDFAEAHQEFKSMDLISMALLEYIEKYKENEK